MSQITVIGEALIDVIRQNGSVSEHPGGSPMNVAITLGRLGDDVELITAIGDDVGGRRIADHLAASNVSVRSLGSAQARTSRATAVLDAAGAAAYKFEIDWDLPRLEPVTSDWLHAGSIALFLQPGARQVHDAIEATAGGAIVSLDPNIRPALVGPRSTARARFDGLVASADVVKLSDEDALWLYDTDDEDLLAVLTERGVSVAVLTRGARGSVLRSGDAMLEMPAAEATVADTVGAGDAYMGALIHAIAAIRARSVDLALRRLTLDELEAVGRFAVRVAGVTVSRRGADPPRAEELV